MRYTKIQIIKTSVLGLTVVVVLAITTIAGKNLQNSGSVEEPQTEPLTEAAPNNEKEAVVEQLLPTIDLEAPQEPEDSQETQQWPVTYSSAEASSISVVINKKHRLPSSYVPDLQPVAVGQMHPEAANALQNLLNAAQTVGNSMVVISSYRSYQTQVSTYQKWVDLHGQAEADRESARAGHSEHQTGLAVDLGNPDGSCRLLSCFGTGAAGKWLSENAHEYGFIIRYPDGKESLTGYIYEPWHIRYLGVELATAVYNSGKTLDQYFGIEAGGYN